MSFRGPFPLGSELCAAVGLDPAIVRSIRLTVGVAEAPFIEVEMYVTEDVAKVITTKRFELKETES